MIILIFIISILLKLNPLILMVCEISLYKLTNEIYKYLSKMESKACILNE